MSFLYDEPVSRGVANVLKRTRQFLDIEWTSTMELGIFDQNDGFIYSTYSSKKESRTFKSMPYSSTRVLDKFVGLEIGIDTFLTALENPASVMYTQNLRDIGSPGYNCCIGNAFLTYGTVCSGFVSYALALPIHRSTREYDIAPEFFRIPDQSADGLHLGDALVTTRPDGRTGGHVRMVTAIGRDESGHVREVEISEGREPVCCRLRMTAEELNDTLLGQRETYQIFRYRHIDSVEYSPARFESDDISNKDLMLNFGSFSNYRTTEPVEFNINCSADTLVIEGTETKFKYDVSTLGTTEIHGNEYRILTVSDLKPDRYRAYCEINGIQTLPVNFIVVEVPEIKVKQADGSDFRRIALKPVAPDGSELTETSSCLYDDSGKLRKTAVEIALSDGTKLIPARIGIYDRNGMLVARPAAMLTDAEGNIVESFVIGENPVMYACAAKENSTVRLEFTQGQCCTALNYTWKEEAAIAYQQDFLSPEEISAGCVETTLARHDNSFAHVMLFCKNEFGKITTKPVLFIVE